MQRIRCPYDFRCFLGPGRVSDLKLTVPEDQPANLAWTAPRMLNGPLDGYIVTIIGPGDSDTVILNTTLPQSTQAFALETDECFES